MPSRYATWCSAVGAVLLVLGLPMWVRYERGDRLPDFLNPWIFVVEVGVILIIAAAVDMRSGRK